MAEQNKNGNGYRISIINIIVQLVIGVVVALSFHTINKIDDRLDRMSSRLDRYEDRQGTIAADVAEMKGNRFTSKDGLEVWREIAEIRAEIGTKK